MVPPISGSGAWSAAGRPLPCCSEVLTAPRTPAHRRMSPGKECVVIPRAEAPTPARDAASGPSPDRHGGHASTRAATAAPPRPGDPRGSLSISGSLTLTPMAKAIPAGPDRGGTCAVRPCIRGRGLRLRHGEDRGDPGVPAPGARADLPPDCASGIGDATRRSGRTAVASGQGAMPLAPVGCEADVRERVNFELAERLVGRVVAACRGA
jgi:hypothetical protein